MAALWTNEAHPAASPADDGCTQGARPLCFREHHDGKCPVGRGRGTRSSSPSTRVPPPTSPAELALHAGCRTASSRSSSTGSTSSCMRGRCSPSGGSFFGRRRGRQRSRSVACSAACRSASSCSTELRSAAGGEELEPCKGDPCRFVERFTAELRRLPSPRAASAAAAAAASALAAIAALVAEEGDKRDRNRADLAGFRAELLQREGNFAAAWRKCLDPKAMGHLSLEDFTQACHRLGYNGELQELWRELDAEVAGVLTLDGVDWDTAEALGRLHAALLGRYGCMATASIEMGLASGKRLTCGEFCEVLVDEALARSEQEAQKLFDMLSTGSGDESKDSELPQASRERAVAEAQLLWLEAIGSRLPRPQARRVRPGSPGWDDCGALAADLGSLDSSPEEAAAAVPSVPPPRSGSPASRGSAASRRSSSSSSSGSSSGQPVDAVWTRDALLGAFGMGSRSSATDSRNSARQPSQRHHTGTPASSSDACFLTASPGQQRAAVGRRTRPVAGAAPPSLTGAAASSPRGMTPRVFARASARSDTGGGAGAVSKQPRGAGGSIQPTTVAGCSRQQQPRQRSTRLQQGESVTATGRRRRSQSSSSPRRRQQRVQQQQLQGQQQQQQVHRHIKPKGHVKQSKLSGPSQHDPHCYQQPRQVHSVGVAVQMSLKRNCRSNRGADVATISGTPSPSMSPDTHDWSTADVPPTADAAIRRQAKRGNGAVCVLQGIAGSCNAAGESMAEAGSVATDADACMATSPRASPSSSAVAAGALTSPIEDSRQTDWLRSRDTSNGSEHQFSHADRTDVSASEDATEREACAIEHSAARATDMAASPRASPESSMASARALNSPTAEPRRGYEPGVVELDGTGNLRAVSPSDGIDLPWRACQGDDCREEGGASRCRSPAGGAFPRSSLQEARRRRREGSVVKESTEEQRQRRSQQEWLENVQRSVDGLAMQLDMLYGQSAGSTDAGSVVQECDEPTSNASPVWSLPSAASTGSEAGGAGDATACAPSAAVAELARRAPMSVAGKPRSRACSPRAFTSPRPEHMLEPPAGIPMETWERVLKAQERRRSLGRLTPPVAPS